MGEKLTKVRPFIFWPHLVAGVTAGIVILMMSATGVLLTYERQIMSWVENGYLDKSATDVETLSADELLAVAQRSNPDVRRFTLTYSSDPNSVVRISAGRRNNLLIDPYRGEVLHEGQTSIAKFFAAVTEFHRWFAMSGESRATGRAITAYSNLLFLFVLCSGIYLWLPRVWNRAIVKTKVLFNPKVKTGKARDYNWHHVFSFWSVIPLFLMVTTASVFYFPWANDLVFGTFGEDPPERRRNSAPSQPLPESSSVMTHADLLQLAMSEMETRGVTDWETISMQASTTPQMTTSFRIDRSIGGQPSMVYNLQLDTAAGRVTSWRTFADNSPGSRARSNIRFLHTGEVFGVVGQTIAGIGSLAACLLVWTGLALAWRRLLSPLFVVPV
jgi:uncharacterized iron-regulated membrane protein